MCVLFGFITQAQPQYSFEQLAINNKLSQRNVQCMLQDSEGFLWFGTQDGLNRYDGYAFKVFRSTPNDTLSLSDNYINVIFEDCNDALWIGTQNGLNKFHKGKDTFQRYSFPHSNKKLSDAQSVLCIAEDTIDFSDKEKKTKQILWFATKDGFLHRSDVEANASEYFSVSNDSGKNAGNNYITRLLRDRFGTLWIGTMSGGLLCFNDKEKIFHQYLHDEKNPSSISANYISDVFEDAKGRLWVATEGGGLCLVVRAEDGAIYFKRCRTAHPETPASQNFSTLCEDKSGNIWAGYHGYGLDKLHVNENDSIFVVHFSSQLNEPNTISPSTVLSLLVDRSNTLWIGTLGSGVYKYNMNRKKFNYYRNNYSDKNSIRNKSIRGIYEDSDGIVWIGGYEGLDKLDRAHNSTKTYRFNDPRTRDPIIETLTNVYSITGDPVNEKQYLWLGIEGGGVLKFDKESENYEHFRYNPRDTNSLWNNWVFSLFAESNGSLWLGTGAGVLNKLNVMEKPARFVKYVLNTEKQDSTHGLRITSILKDKQGMFWVGSFTDGLYSFRPDEKIFSPQHFASDRTDKKNLKIHRVLCLFEDRDEDLWIGTNGGGLQRLNRERNTVQQYTENDGLSNNVVYGIVEDSRRNLWMSTNKGITKFYAPTRTFKTYDVDDGLQNNEFNTGSFYQCKHGEIFFGGINGFNSFFPDSIFDNEYIPPVVITCFRKFHKEIKFEKPVSSMGQIPLNYDENVLAFEFAALDFTAPEQNQYAYKMEGIDNEWIYCGTQRFASYSHLAPGNYIFRVIGSNNDGVWNNVGASVVFVIAPPYWETWWFRTMIFFVFALIIVLVLYRRSLTMKREREQQHEFSRKFIASVEEERKRIARDLHDGLAQDLLLIKNQSEIIQHLKKDYDETMEQVKHISEISSQSINNVRAIIYNLRPAHLERFGLTDTIDAMLQQIMQTSSIRWNVQVENIDNVISKENEIHFYRILQESINNIVKHSFAFEASIEVKKDEDKITVKVIDDGKGFAIHAPSFQPGIGLRGLEERAALLGGTLQIHSILEEGTELLFIIPVLKKNNGK